MSDPKSVSISVSAYRVLVRIYPWDFRQAYGDAMIQNFRDLCLHDKNAGLVSVWGRVLLDYAVTLVSEHMRRGAEMSRSRWIELSGWGLAASGFLLMAGFAASDRPEYNPYNAASWPIDPFLNSVDLILIAGAMLLMGAGMIGFLVRYQEQIGVLGRTGCLIGAVGGLTSMVGGIGLGFQDGGPWWDLFMIGVLAVNLGMSLFGITCLRERLFERWNGLPLALGVTFLLFSLLSINLVQWSNTVVTVVFLLFTLSLALIGYRLQASTKGRQGVVV